MKRQPESVAGLLGRRDCLGHTCGTNIDTEDVEFTRQQSSLTFIDKVFSFNKDTASPILFGLNTGGPNSNNFVSELFLEGNSLFPCTLAPNAVFEIDNSFVAVEFFETRPPGNISASQVTLDGFPVDSVNFANGQYTARIDNVLTRIQKDRCLDRGLPTKAFFLISNAGPWDLRATYVLEGTVNTNGRVCRFRAEISNAPNAPNTMLPGNGLSTFAIRNLSVPCAINGVAPRILFQFDARVNLVNPRLIVNCNPQVLVNPCTVSLMTNIAVEPVVHVQTVRKTLFCINACEGLQPCDGSVLAAEIADNIEDCAIGGVDRSDCRCGRRRDTSDTSDTHDTSCGRRTNTEDFPRRRNNAVGGVGTGPCEDCVWGETEGHDCIPCRHRRNRTAGAEDHGRKLRSQGGEAGAGRNHRDSHFRNDILGETDRKLIKGLLREIREELDEDFREDSGTGFGPEEILGIEDDTREPSERFSQRAGTAYRHHGCNGCSW